MLIKTNIFCEKYCPRFFTNKSELQEAWANTKKYQMHRRALLPSHREFQMMMNLDPRLSGVIRQNETELLCRDANALLRLILSGARNLGVIDITTGVIESDNSLVVHTNAAGEFRYMYTFGPVIQTRTMENGNDFRMRQFFLALLCMDDGACRFRLVKREMENGTLKSSAMDMTYNGGPLGDNLFDVAVMFTQMQERQPELRRFILALWVIFRYLLAGNIDFGNPFNFDPRLSHMRLKSNFVE